MKTDFTFKNHLTPYLFLFSVMFFSITSPVSGSVKHVVTVTDYKFTPNELTISIGDTVEWKNTDGYHNVNGTQITYSTNPGSFGNNPGSNWTYSYVFTSSGKYNYQCDPHVGLGMVGMILVSGTTAMKHIVNVSNYKFTPNELQIEIGDTIEWQNTQGNHNVNGNKTTFPSNPESFGNSVGSGWTFHHVFNTAGKYDYQCDPHVAGGMIGKIEVKDGSVDEGKYKLTVNFTGMTPHVGQDLWLSLSNKNSGIEIERKKVVASVGFEVVFSGIEKNHSYNIDFYADHNKNGGYDAPPVDHAWRLELNDVTDDTTLDFQHNTNFTDIKWKNKLTVHFTGMNPHVGENLHLAVIEKNMGMVIQRLNVTAEVDFIVEVFGIENGMSYDVDFFADHNYNGNYDAPPADHAWRIELNDVMGDTTLNFQHNTNFTDIMWKNELMVYFMGMNPHVGQNLQMAVIDKNSGMEIQRINVTATSEFMVSVYGIEKGKSYNIDFFADHNKNGMYDTPPADHAWRIELNDVIGDTMLTFHHNTNFTDILWKNKLTVHFMGMNPHVGQNLQLGVSDKNSGIEIQRVNVISEVDFMVDVFGIENGKSYNVDFFADHNKNGMYDTPPADHAWRIELNDVIGDTTLMFMHNTNFTDINWITTSVSDNKNLSVIIYPNPATDKVFIKMNEIQGTETQVSIYDISGRLKLHMIKQFNTTTEIDIQHLNKGIYFIDLRTNDIQKMLKFTKH